MSTKSERRAAREAVAAYHEVELARLVALVGDAIDSYRAGQLGAFDVDEILLQYSRAAKDLWKFCNMGRIEFIASLIREQPRTDWWERGAPKRH